ncbi:MAG TPA: thiamine phosphate synthase [Gemmataceae bacterium]|nr:thiamine phosphate synthase [Gemmataceae bacterium]
MLPELTPAVARVLETAQRHASLLGSSEVLPIHLLHALLAEEEGRAWSLAVAAGLDAAAFRRAGSVSDGGASVAYASGSSLPLHPNTRSALFAARDLAREISGESTVASDALLLALIRCDETVAAELASFGLRVAELESTLLAQRQPPPALEQPLHLSGRTESMDAARLLDACANRAREGLRVLEDYCRFVLDDAFLCRTLKEWRHDLTAALAELSPSLLLEARDTRHDVGTEMSTLSEQQRESLRDVVRANCKRLQESLRSLEEYGKIQSSLLGQALEQLRYRAYTLERALVLGVSARQRLQGAQLYVLLTGSRCVATLDWIIAEAAAGGASIVQLREKDKSDRELLERARQVRQWTRQAGVLFVVNDRADIARLIEADGVHLGQDDLPVREARRILGSDALIGVSTHNMEQLRQAILDGASYVGIGPTFPSGTKDFAELAGLEFARQAMAETTLPAFVIGGVTPQTIDAAVAAGARRVAVSSAIAQAEDPRSVAAMLLAALPGI